MKRRVTDYWLAHRPGAVVQMVRLECGHTRPVPGARTELEAHQRAEVAHGDRTVAWYEDCPMCSLVERTPLHDNPELLPS